MRIIIARASRRLHVSGVGSNDVPLARLIRRLEVASERDVVARDLTPDVLLLASKTTQKALLLKEAPLVVEIVRPLRCLPRTTLLNLRRESGKIETDLTRPLVHDPRQTLSVLLPAKLNPTMIKLLVLSSLPEVHWDDR
jgi:hypothetical protein